jgi:hypothetical protein
MKGLCTIFRADRSFGKRFWISPPHGDFGSRIVTFDTLDSLRAGSGNRSGDWHVCSAVLCRAVCRAASCVCYDVVSCRCYDLALRCACANSVTSSRCIRSGVCCCAGAVCRYIAVADTRRRATRGACIATRIALPTVRIRGCYDNISVTNKQIQYEIIHTQ